MSLALQEGIGYLRDRPFDFLGGGGVGLGFFFFSYNIFFTDQATQLIFFSHGQRAFFFFFFFFQHDSKPIYLFIYFIYFRPYILFI